MTRKNNHRKNMNTSFISSTSIKQFSSNFHVLEGLNEDATAYESKISDEETIDVEEQEHLSRSTGVFESNTSGVPVFDSQDDHNKNIDDKEQEHLPKSTGFDSKDSCLPPYDPVTNYLSPRPKFLKYNPERHREILARQEKLKILLDHFIKEREEIVNKSVRNREEHEKEEEFEDDVKFGLKMFLQYLLVMVVLILMTLIIPSMNSPRVSLISLHGFNVSETEAETFDHMMLMAGHLSDIEIDKGYIKHDHNAITVSTKDLVAMQHDHRADVCADDEVKDLETVLDFIMLEPIILSSKMTETYRFEDEIEVYDLDPSNVNEESEILKPIVDEDEIEVYDLSSSHVNEESEILKPIVDEDETEVYDLSSSNVNEESEILKPIVDEDEIEVYDLGSSHVNEESEILKPIVDEDETEVYDLSSSNVNEESEILKPIVDEDEIEVYDLGSSNANEKSEILKPIVDEDEIEVYDLSSSHVNEESEILKPTVDEDESTKSLNVIEYAIEGNETSKNVTKMAYFDLFFVVFGSAIAIVMLTCTRALCCSMQSEIDYVNEVFDESSYAGSFGSKSSRFLECHEINKAASSSNQTNYFDIQQSTDDSHSHGSFTIEKKIVKNKRSKTSEVMISAVRRSSRIHNRSISSP
ncbi:hypothetical protein R6Q59_013001 [Mikania micrantha]